MYLDPVMQALSAQLNEAETSIAYDAMGDGLTFVSPPLTAATEITGPSAAKLFVSSSTADADLFLVLRVFSADFKEVAFQGAIDPHTPVAQGWLRASHRKLDRKLSTPFRPYHTHDELQPIEPDEIVELDIELWPTSVVVPAGIALHSPCAVATTYTRRQRRQVIQFQERADRVRPVFA
jgi:predicted acyl esterase